MPDLEAVSSITPMQGLTNSVASFQGTIKAYNSYMREGVDKAEAVEEAVAALTLAQTSHENALADVKTHTQGKAEIEESLREAGKNIGDAVNAVVESVINPPTAAA